MEGVEDIPGTVLAEGVKFDWESFPEYLGRLEAMPRAVDVGAQVPHAALRFYVMGERGAPPLTCRSASSLPMRRRRRRQPWRQPYR
jgi:N-acyl-D-aspartate/D-glutamate deacylase